MPKVVLALNHVISSEDAAMTRLLAHAGRHLRFECQGPAGLPALPALVLLITPAGLLDLPETPHAEAPSVDLDILVDASNPLAVRSEA